MRGFVSVFLVRVFVLVGLLGLVLIVRGGWVDVDTPKEAYKVRANEDGYPYHIVFSDEFNVNGRNFYDVGAPYHCFAGKVVSRALVKGSVEAEDIEAEDFIADFRESEVEELRERVRFYEEKYRRVGVLKHRDEFLALGIL